MLPSYVLKSGLFFMQNTYYYIERIDVPNNLRTLPLHTSQKEIGQTDEYTDFSYDIRPSVGFVLALMSYIDGKNKINLSLFMSFM